MTMAHDTRHTTEPLNVHARNRIQEQRKKKKLTAAHLGRLIGSGRSTIVKLERGERRLHLGMMEKIADALGVKPADLLPEEQVNLLPDGIVMCPLVDAEDLVCLMEDGTLPERERTMYPMSYLRPTLVLYMLHDSSIDRLATIDSSIAIDCADKDLTENGLFMFLIGGKPTPRVYKSLDGPVRLEPFSHVAHTTLYPCPKQMFPVIGRIVKAAIDVPLEITP